MRGGTGPGPSRISPNRKHLFVPVQRATLDPEDASEAELKKRTLTNLYNQRPAWLEHAHGRVDEAVAAAYGFAADLPDEEIFARLLALNLGRAAGAGE